MIISKQMGKNLSRLTDEYKEVRTYQDIVAYVLVNKQWIVQTETMRYWDYGYTSKEARDDFFGTVKSDYNLGSTTEGYAEYYGI